MEEIIVNYHSSIRINNTKVIYVDPYNIENKINDADFIFITHSHFDHFSEKDVLKVKNDKTVIYITKDLYERSIDLGFDKENIKIVLPNNSYIINDNISFETIPAYNVNKGFHKKEYDLVR